jgi:hypothetical protein
VIRKNKLRGKKGASMRDRLRLIVTLTLLLVSACGAATTASKPTPTSTAAITEAPAVSADAKVKARAALTAATEHYAAFLVQGQAAVGTTPYADSTAGLAAMNDSNSSASRFTAWRQSSNAEGDVSTYLNAFHKAQSDFGGQEPRVVDTWQSDMDEVQIAIVLWVKTAVSWQISEKTKADLSAAATRVTTGIQKARADIAAIS